MLGTDACGRQLVLQRRAGGTIVELNNVLIVESGHTNGAPLGMLLARALEFVAREYTHREGKISTTQGSR